ncbi:MAG: DUF4038 domain-containing protein [Verrucomicrobia subdivision 3 bacterium]|nr:DUF4038 domain-containing protein [Limisphaerales bacterium]
MKSIYRIIPGFLAAFTLAHAAPKDVARWQRFETTLQSAADYTNPVQQASLTATFTSPSGKKHKVYGFWDGEKTWKIRFAPNEKGKWTYSTECSDKANNGLNVKTGEFNCAGPSGSSRFDKHGPIRVSNDQRYLAHDDDTPFFFLADTAWNGALLSSDSDWDLYIKERTRQKFTAVQWVTTQWRASPEGDRNKDLAYTGSNSIAINPKFFQRLDQKADALTKAGLLNVPVLLWAIAGGSNPRVNPGVSLPDDQAILLARYMVARWQANPVLWILAGDGDYRREKAEKWKRIGRAVFNGISHAPVTMHPGGMQWVWNEFKDEDWYGVVGYQSGHGDDDKTLRWMTEGPLTEDWTKMPHRPLINLEPPYENHIAYQSKIPISPEIVRRAIYWTLLNNPTAGVTYGGHGVWGWDDGTKPPADHPGTGIPLPWQKALTMPAAEQMAYVYDFFTTNDFHRLRPTPVFVVNNPGKDKPAKFVTAARTDQKDTLIVYVPEDRTIEIKLNALPPSPNITWINPRNGQKSPAVAVVTTDTCQFPTPEEGDWLLLMKTGPVEPEPTSEKKDEAKKDDKK